MEPNSIEKKPRGRGAFLLASAMFLVLALASLGVALSIDWEPAGTIVVDKSGRASYSSIREAVQDAPPNTRIRVRPGIYREAFVINKPVEIVGQRNDDSVIERARRFLRRASNQEVVIESADAPCVTMRADHATVRGITLRGFGNASSEPFPTVAVLEGSLNLETCDVTSQSFAGVGVRGSAASCSMHRCKITECGLNGVLVLAEARALLEDCEVARNNFAGLRIDVSGSAIVRRSRIRDGAQGGVLVLNGAFAALEDCDVYGNELTGLEVRENGKARVVSSRIQYHKRVGVYVHDGGLAALDDCDISHNSCAGVTVTDNAAAELRRCKIHDIPRNAVEVCKNSTAILEACSVFGNTGVGIMITEGSKPVLRGCETQGNTWGIQVSSGANPLVQGCTITDGLLITKNGEGTFEDCDFVNTAFTAVSIKDGGNPVLRRCKMRDGKGGGVYVYRNGAGLVEDCEIYGNHCAGIGIAEGGNPVIRRCKINRNGEPAIRMFNDGLGRVEDCDLTDNVGGAWGLEGKSRVEQSRNKEQ